METIRVEREKLLNTLRENRIKHEEEYVEAVAGWIKKATKALEKAAKRAREKEDIDIQPLKGLPKPVNYIRSYDDAIRRVEMDVRPELEIDDREFSAWVQDDWNWRDQFAATTQLYNR